MDKKCPCSGCRFASWKMTASGRLHPSGDGVCTYEWVLPPLPASMYWVGWLGGCPTPSGGYINRHGYGLEIRACVCFEAVQEGAGECLCSVHPAG